MDASSRPQCLPGTRTEVLEQIMDWIFSDTEENILWLRGVAGSGKSTISMTIAEFCVYMRRRGAHLFFERGKSDPKSVIRTIAFWLASFDKSIADQVSLIPTEYASIKILYNKFVNAQSYEATIIEAFSEEAIKESGKIEIPASG